MKEFAQIYACDRQAKIQDDIKRIRRHLQELEIAMNIKPGDRYLIDFFNGNPAIEAIIDKLETTLTASYVHYHYEYQGRICKDFDDLDFFIECCCDAEEK